MPTGNLPSHGKKIWENVYNSAKGPGCDEGCAARQAWAAVKRKYKKVGNEWVAKADLGDVDVEKWVGVEHTPIEKSAAGFQENVGVAGTQCGDCLHFMNPASCTVVRGDIGVKDLCTFFDPNIAFGDISSIYARSEFDMVITKASVDPKTGVRRWAAVASDTDLDSFEDRMSLDLYRDFIQHIDGDDPLPAVFTSEAWQGGMPYLGISHYMDLDGYGIAGDTSVLYIDGNRLKAKGVFRDTDVGMAAFTAIKRDMSENVAADQRIRVSIAFYELEHKHGDTFVFSRRSLGDVCPMCSAGIGNKIYTRGQLIHLALTRIPANERTPIWLEAKSMATMRDDATAVLGDDALVTELERRSEETKKKKMLSKGPGEEIAAGAVVIKSEDEAPDAPVVETPVEDSTPEAEAVTARMYGGATSLQAAEEFLTQQDKMYEILDAFSMLQGVMENVIFDSEVQDKPAAIKSLISEFKDRVDDAVKRSLAIRAAQTILGKEGETMTEQEHTEPVATPAATPLDQAFAALSEAVSKARSDKGMPVAERYKAVQPALNSFADVIKSEIGGEEAQSAELASTISRAVAEQLKPVVDALTAATARSAAAPSPTVPTPRAFQPGSITDQPAGSKSPLTQMIRRSVGLRE